MWRQTFILLGTQRDLTLKDRRSAHCQVSVRNFWLYSVLLLVVSATNGCDASEPVVLETRLDQGTRAVDATPALTDSGTDAVDMVMTTDTSGPADCQAEERDCGNRIDDDCDGLVDECSAGLTCQAGSCEQAAIGQECNNHTDCPSQTICFNSMCESIRPSMCGSGGPCNGTTQCSTIELCQAGPICYGTWQAPCETSCDCTGTLLCRESNQTCVACLNGGQCNSGEVCSADGSCHEQFTFGAEDVDTVPQRLFAALKACVFQATGRESSGCGQFNLDGDVNPDVLAQLNTELDSLFECESLVANVPEEDVSFYQTLLGCEDPQRVHVFKSDRFAIAPGTFACMTYIPYPPPSGPTTDWYVQLKNCTANE